MGKVSTLIRAATEPRLWTVSDFPGESPGAVAAALSRLSRAGLLRRIRRGVYEKPVGGRFGPRFVDTGAIATAIGKRTGAQLSLSGVDAWRNLGLTTQVGAYPVYLTDRWLKPLGEENPRIVFRRTTRPILDLLPESERAYLLAIRNLERIPGSDPHAVVERLIELIRKNDVDVNRMALAAKAEPPRARAALGAIASAAGASGKRLEELRVSLNPLTRYHIAPLRDLYTSRAWGIR